MERTSAELISPGLVSAILGSPELHALGLRHLHYFVVLAAELNFRRAAERLHVSTPALSMQIKKLEGILGVQLCERSTTQVRLTVAGEVFLHQARDVLTRMREVTQATRETARGQRGRLRIGIPGNYNPLFMPVALQAYRERFPNVDLTLVDLNMEEEQMEALEEDRIHLGFVYASLLPLMKGVDHLLMVDAPVRVVMGAHHPLAALKQVPLAKAAAYPIYINQAYKHSSQKMLDVFRNKKLTPKAVTGAGSVHACVVMLSGGDGVTLLPEIGMLSNNPALALRPVKGEPNLRVQVHAVWKKADVCPHVSHFVEILRKAVQATYH